MERLQKMIARAGIASRRHAEALIESGAVAVNGAVVTTLGTKINPDRDRVFVHGQPIRVVERKIYLLLNKPIHCITSRSDPQGRKTVMDLVKEIPESIYPVGRLDFDSEGLILLTNDGDLASALMHPSREVEKTYHVKISEQLTEAQMAKIARGGIALPTGRTAPCKIRLLRTTAQYSWVEIVLHEGKNREVRRIMQKMGHPVNKLKRVAYAFLKIGDLAPGEWRMLTPGEVDRLRKLSRNPKARPAPVQPNANLPIPGSPSAPRRRASRQTAR